MGPALDCDACIDGTCHCTQKKWYTLSLMSTATCCIDSIVITPPSGVCWSGCVAINGTTPPDYWGHGLPNDHISCKPGDGRFFGSLGGVTTYDLCPGGSLTFECCSTDDMHGGGTGTITFYWTDSTYCTLIIP